MRTASETRRRETRAHVRVPSAPKPRASMVVASLPERRSANTSSENAPRRKERMRDASPTPRARRALSSAFQSAAMSAVMRAPASEASTGRAGRRTICARPSPMSVGSMRSSRAIAGMTIAHMRMPMPIASQMECSEIAAGPSCQ